jgi:glycerol uptake facilitator-like aquaporin
LNPARQIGPELLGGLIGATTHLDQLWVYIVGPIAGGLGGAFLYEYVGHHRTAEVPGLAVAEVAHADA